LVIMTCTSEVQMETTAFDSASPSFFNKNS
jgi:hypothetical protein